MPHTKSAKRRHRQSLERRTKNRATKSAIKTQIKKVRAAIASGDMATAETELRTATTQMDRAGAKRIIHPNKAARTKSRRVHLMKAAKAN